MGFGVNQTQYPIPDTLDPSFSHCLDDYALWTLPVPLPIEDPLPGPEVEPSGGDRDDDLVADGQTPQVGGGVVLACTGIVPVVSGVPRGDSLLQPIEDVLPES